MIIKNPKPAYRKWLKRGAVTLFVIEAACFIGSYAVWHKINTERDFRHYLHNNYPAVLEVFYKTGEIINSENNIRQIDQAQWANKRV